MKIKILFFLLSLLIAVPSPANCWFFDKTDAQLLQEALRSNDPETVDECMDRHIEKRRYTAVLRLKHHAMRMKQKERGRINGIPGSTSADIARGMEPWQKIIQKADTLTKKRTPYMRPAR